MTDVAQVKTRLTRRRWLTLAAAAGGALAAGAALSSPASASGLVVGSGAATGPATVKSPAAQMKGSQIMNWFAQSSQGGFFSATKNGYYTELGLDMTMTQGGPGLATTPLVATGVHTFGMSSADSVLFAREEGLPVVMVYSSFQVNPQGLMYHLSHPVADFPELNGRKVYVSAPGTYWTFLTAKYNLTEAQQFAYTGQAATFLSDEENVSQCFVSSEPVILKEQGKEVGYLLIADSGFNPYNNAMICLESTIRDQPDLVQAYVTASLKGWMDYVKDPEPTLEYIKSDFNQEKDLTIERKVFDVEKNLLVTGKEGYDPSKLGRLTQERFATLYEQMRGVGVLKKDQDPSAAFDASFIEKAHATLGI
jgi:NitT/TauT family transport system substrate-binding protein